MNIKTFIVEHALSLVAGPIIGVVVYFTQQQIKRGWAWLDAQGPLVKRAFAVGLSALVTVIANAVGIMVPAECQSAADGALAACVTAIGEKHWLTAVVGGAFAMLAHRVLHPPKPVV